MFGWAGRVGGWWWWVSGHGLSLAFSGLGFNGELTGSHGAERHSRNSLPGLFDTGETALEGISPSSQ